MKNIELVDYLSDIRGKYEILGGSDGEAPDEFITSVEPTDRPYSITNVFVVAIYVSFSFK